MLSYPSMRTDLLQDYSLAATDAFTHRNETAMKFA